MDLFILSYHLSLYSQECIQSLSPFIIHLFFSKVRSSLL
nr:MAG TPA: hypothetical protein [Caudoviricetes sp.]